MDSPVQEGDVLAGKYRVERVLGYGGMGVVVSAFRGDLEQRVAVKFLSQQAAERPDAAERFRREARAAARIKSDHVAQVLDVGTLDTGLPYMVMEYLEGNDIADELRRYERLPISDAVGYMLQAIEALAEAHASGVVHRDLKPGNLFLAMRPDGSRRVKVLDFGISKALSGSSVEELSLTKTAALIGSPLYMAPEQMRSAKDVDTRADIWSLGAMLYEMLTGQPPYTGDSIPQLCAALLHDDPIPLRQHRPEVPEGLEYTVLRCLMKDPAQRWGTVSELGRALLPYALPDSRVHVDRAERVLGTGGEMSAPRTELTSSPVIFSSPGVASTPAQFVTTPQPAPQPIAIEPTINSWGHSGVDAPKKRGLLLLVGGVAAALAAGLGLWAARGDDSEAAKPAGSSAVEASALGAPKPAEAAAPSPLQPALPVEEPAAASAAPEASAEASAAAPSPPRPAPVAATPRPKPLPASAKPPTKKPNTKPAASSSGSAITDFGGRR